MGLTQEVAHFVARTRYRDIPKEVVQLARGFILDGFGVALAGSTDECSRIVQAQIRQMNGKGESSIVGTALSAPAGGHRRLAQCVGRGRETRGAARARTGRACFRHRVGAGAPVRRGVCHLDHDLT